MKKFIAIILCFVYVVASSGATVNFHYCMGKFIGWDVNAATPETCNNCGMHKEAKKGCCNDKKESFQIKKDQLASTINAIPGNHFIYVQQQHLPLIQSSFIGNKVVTQSINSPPLIQIVSPFILYCVFRI